MKVRSCYGVNGNNWYPINALTSQVETKVTPDVCLFGTCLNRAFALSATRSEYLILNAPNIHSNASRLTRITYRLMRASKQPRVSEIIMEYKQMEKGKNGNVQNREAWQPGQGGHTGGQTGQLWSMLSNVRLY